VEGSLEAGGLARATARGRGVAERGSLGSTTFMSTPTFTTVRTARTQIEADLLLSVLRHAGLHPLDLDTSSHFSVAGVDIDYSVRVPTVELSQARDILSEYDANAA